MTHRTTRFGRFGSAYVRLFGGRSHHGVRVRGLFRFRPGGLVFKGLWLFSGLAAAVLVLVGLLAGRLAQGPISIDMLRVPMAAALEQRVGNGYKFDVGGVLIEQGQHGFGLMIDSLAVKDGHGRLVVASLKAHVELDMLALMFGEVKPTRLELADLDVRVAVAPDGSIALSTGAEKGVQVTMPVKADVTVPALVGGADATAPLRALATGIAALVDLGTAEKSPLGALVRVGVGHGKLMIEDQTTQRETTFKDFDLTFDKQSADGSQLSLAATGPNGPWSAKVTASGSAKGGRRLDLEVKDISLAELMLAVGVRRLPFATAMPLSAQLHFDIDAQGELVSAEGTFGLGAGRLEIDDPDQRPFQIDEIAGKLRLDPANRRIEIEALRYFAQETHFALQGAIQAPATSGGAWSATLDGNGVVAPQRKSDPSLQTATAIVLKWDPGAQRFVVDHLALKGPAVDLTASGDIGDDGQGPVLTMKLATGAAMPLRTFATLWPTYAQPQLRAWFLANVLGGRLETGTLDFRCDSSCLDNMKTKRPLPPESLHLDFAVTDASFVAMAGAPPVTAIDGSGKSNARRARFAGTTASVVSSRDRRVLLSDWTFEIPDITPKLMTGTSTARLQAGVDTLADLFRRPALAKFVKVPPEADAMHGKVDAEIGLDVQIADGAAGSPVLRANGRVTGFGFDRLVGDERIENGSLAFSINPDGAHAKGEARIFGVPGTLEVRKPAQGTGEAIIQATFDDAARTRRGLSLAPALTGPVAIKVTAALGQDRPKARVEADLSKASISNLLPGWSKPPGRSAKATFALSRRQDRIVLEQLDLESGFVAIRGNAEFSPGGAFQSAKLSQVRLSPGDEMRVDVLRAVDGMRVSIRAGVLDARPLLRGILSMSGSATAAASAWETPGSAGAIDLDLKAQTVTGQNQRALKSVDLKLTRRGTRIRQLKLSARAGHGQLAASLGAGASPLLSISAADAGAALAFFDFYKHMEGGRLEAAIRMGEDDRQAGSASIDNFVLSDEPAISRVTTQAQAQGGAAESININPSLVKFTRFQTVFSRGAGKVDLSDTVMWGQEIGATVAGSVDFARDYVNLHGTFVPAYQLNNLFARIPFFGPLLGGGENEGLFAVNYRVSGAASQPIVTVNFLTAIAPGFLRQIFGALDNPVQVPQPTAEARSYGSSPPLGFPSADR